MTHANLGLQGLSGQYLPIACISVLGVLRAWRIHSGVEVRAKDTDCLLAHRRLEHIPGGPVHILRRV